MGKWGEMSDRGKRKGEADSPQSMEPDAGLDTGLDVDPRSWPELKPRVRHTL